MTDNTAANDSFIFELGSHKTPRFATGTWFTTVAARQHLSLHGVNPAVLFLRHEHGDFGLISEQERCSNEQAITSGEQIKSHYEVGGVMLWVITKAVRMDGTRRSSCILLPEEY